MLNKLLPPKEVLQVGSKPLSFRSGLGLIVAFFAGVMVLFNFADRVGMKVDRWHWQSEHDLYADQDGDRHNALVLASRAEREEIIESLTEKYDTLVGMSLDYVLTQKKRRLYEVEAAIAEYESKGLPAPWDLVNERDILIGEISELKRQLGK